MKFEAVFNIPSIIAIASFAALGLGGFYSVKEVQAVNTQSIAALEKADQRHEAQLRELKADSTGPLAEIKGDVKDLRTAMSDVKESLAILRGRAISRSGEKGTQ